MRTKTFFNSDIEKLIYDIGVYTARLDNAETPQEYSAMLKRLNDLHMKLEELRLQEEIEKTPLYEAINGEKDVR
jgi:hypothetical protein